MSFPALWDFALLLLLLFIFFPLVFVLMLLYPDYTSTWQSLDSGIMCSSYSAVIKNKNQNKNVLLILKFIFFLHKSLKMQCLHVTLNRNIKYKTVFLFMIHAFV